MLVVLLSVLVFMSLVMAVAWAYVRHTGNGGWTDVFWTFGTGLAGVATALAPGSDPATSPYRQLLVAVLVALWSLRLGTYIFTRVSRGAEDARYVQLNKEWGGFGAKAFGFLQIQAPATTLLCSAIYLAAAKPSPGLAAFDVAGLAILAVAVVGEGLADRQMKAFKADAANHGRDMDRGLWAWSRHPNYFFEWLGWLAYPVIALAPGGAPYPLGWLSLLGPAFMFWLLTRVTGAPPLEQAMVASKGDAYLDYQQRVSAFFPLPPRSD